RTYIREIWTTKDERGALAVIHPQFERSLYELTRLFQYTIPGLRELTNRLPSTAYLQKLNPRPSKRPTYTL
uniref:hypothetical protein n=1 Tax=Sutterella wadsworthensis TaxID=40545 RepID=UPI0039679622